MNAILPWISVLTVCPLLASKILKVSPAMAGETEMCTYQQNQQKIPGYAHRIIL